METEEDKPHWQKKKSKYLTTHHHGSASDMGLLVRWPMESWLTERLYTKPPIEKKKYEDYN